MTRLSHSPNKSVLNGKWVLLVGPDLSAMHELGRHLSGQGANVDVASNYEIAVQSLLSLTYDAAVIDGGVDRVSDLIEITSWKHMPAIMTPNGNDPGIHHKDRTHQVVSTLEKAIRNGK
ncbi:MAG: hypothetical protein AB1646_14290 [Thermodesulfobacteriota bacterium]